MGILYFIIPNITYQATWAQALAYNSQHHFTHSLPNFLFSNYKDLLSLLWTPLIFLFLCSCGSPFKICSSHNSLFNWQLLLVSGVQIPLLFRSFRYLASPYLSRHHFVIYLIALYYQLLLGLFTSYEISSVLFLIQTKPCDTITETQQMLKEYF